MASVVMNMLNRALESAWQWTSQLAIVIGGLVDFLVGGVQLMLLWAAQFGVYLADEVNLLGKIALGIHDAGWVLHVWVTLLGIIVWLVILALLMRLFRSIVHISTSLLLYFVLGLLRGIQFIGMYIKTAVIRWYLSSKDLLDKPCFFCHAVVFVSRQQQQGWRCPHCMQYNGFDDSGDYNLPLEQVFAGRGTLGSKPSQTAKDVTLLCPTCSHRQARYPEKIAAFEPSCEEMYAVEAEAHEQQVKAATALCGACQARVAEHLKSVNRKVMQIHWNQSWSQSLRDRLSSIQDELPLRVRALLRALAMLTRCERYARHLFVGLGLLLAVLLLVHVDVDQGIRSPLPVSVKGAEYGSFVCSEWRWGPYLTFSDVLQFSIGFQCPSSSFLTLQWHLSPTLTAYIEFAWKHLLGWTVELFAVAQMTEFMLSVVLFTFIVLVGGNHHPVSTGQLNKQCDCASWIALRQSNRVRARMATALSALLIQGILFGCVYFIRRHLISNLGGSLWLTDLLGNQSTALALIVFSLLYHRWAILVPPWHLPLSSPPVAGKTLSGLVDAARRILGTQCDPRWIPLKGSLLTQHSDGPPLGEASPELDSPQLMDTLIGLSVNGPDAAQPAMTNNPFSSHIRLNRTSSGGFVGQSMVSPSAPVEQMFGGLTLRPSRHSVLQMLEAMVMGTVAGIGGMVGAVVQALWRILWKCGWFLFIKGRSYAMSVLSPAPHQFGDPSMALWTLVGFAALGRSFIQAGAVKGSWAVWGRRLHISILAGLTAHYAVVAAGLWVVSRGGRSRRGRPSLARTLAQRYAIVAAILVGLLIWASGSVVDSPAVSAAPIVSVPPVPHSFPSPLPSDYPQQPPPYVPGQDPMLSTTTPSPTRGGTAAPMVREAPVSWKQATAVEPTGGWMDVLQNVLGAPNVALLGALLTALRFRPF